MNEIIINSLPYVAIPAIFLGRELLWGRTLSSVANLAAKKDKISYTQKEHKISVIIAAHDQAAYLEENLPLILDQDYPDFEVIVIDDNSTDETEDVLKSLRNRYPRLYCTHTSPTTHYISTRKLALTLGIRAAKGDWIVFTEADCTPSSSSWLSLMARNFKDDIDIVLGYSNYKRTGSLSNSLCRYIRLIQALKSFSTAIYHSKAYMGDGCNMALRRSAVYENKIFQRNLELKRGEDILLVNEVARRGNTVIECDERAIMFQEMPLRDKAITTDRVFEVETKKRLNLYGKANCLFYHILDFLTVMILLLAGIGIIYGTIKSDVIMISESSATILLMCLIDTFLLYRSTSALSDGKFLLLPFYEGIRYLSGLYFRIRHTFTNKREFYRH